MPSPRDHHRVARACQQHEAILFTNFLPRRASLHFSGVFLSHFHHGESGRFLCFWRSLRLSMDAVKCWALSCNGDSMAKNEGPTLFFVTLEPTLWTRMPVKPSPRVPPTLQLHPVLSHLSRRVLVSCSPPSTDLHPGRICLLFSGLNSRYYRTTFGLVVTLPRKLEIPNSLLVESSGSSFAPHFSFASPFWGTIMANLLASGCSGSITHPS